MEYVVWHERQHAKIAKEYADGYEKVLREASLRKSSDCNILSLKAFLKRNRMERVNMKKQKAFDRAELARNGRGYRAQIGLRLAK